MRKNFMVAMFGLVFTTVYSQDTLRTTTQLEEVVISATRNEQPILETARSVSVITRDQLEKSIYNSVGDLLSQQSGMYVVGSNQTPGSTQSLFMRGTGSNQVAVLIDGVRITDPSSPSSAIDLSELSVANVERIEIIRGSHSTLYGGSAIGGVVNIITRKNAAQGFHGNASIQPGSLGNASWALSGNVNATQTWSNGVYLNGSIFQQNVKGLDASLPLPPESSAVESNDLDDFRKTDAHVKLGLRKNKWDAFIAYKHTAQLAEIDNGAFSDDDNNYLEFKRDFFQYNLSRILSNKWSVSLLGSLSNSTRINENDSSMIFDQGVYDGVYFKGNYDGQIQTHELTFKYSGEKLNGVFGVGTFYEKMNFDTYVFFNDPDFPFSSKTNYDSINTSVDTPYAFAELNYTLQKFSITAGSRLSHHELAGTFATFEISPSYMVTPDLLVYGSASSGFNAPSLYQLYDPTKGFSAYGTRGNRDLDPETSLSFELGVKKEFATGSYFTLSAYQNTIKNSIEYVYLWNGEETIDNLSYDDDRGDTYVNISEQNVQGIEVDGRINILKKLYVNANVTFLSAKITASPQDISLEKTGGNHVQLYNYGAFLLTDYENERLTRRPTYTGFFQLNYQPVSSVTLGMNYRHAGARFDVGYDGSLGPYGALNQFRLSGYDLFDLSADWRISKSFSLGGKIENILNEKYSEISGYQTRGTTSSIKFTARW